MDQNFRFSIVQFVNGPGLGPGPGPGLGPGPRHGLINHKSELTVYLKI